MFCPYNFKNYPVLVFYNPKDVSRFICYRYKGGNHYILSFQFQALSSVILRMCQGSYVKI